MTRHYDDTIDVARRDDEPAQFLWRGRLYVVRGVLAHWVETGAWWRSASARALYSGDSGKPLDLVPHAALADAALADAALADPAPAAPAPAAPALPDPATASLDLEEREVWRVEAGAGRSSGTGVFDLSFDWSAGRWTLARALD